MPVTVFHRCVKLRPRAQKTKLLRLARKWCAGESLGFVLTRGGGWRWETGRTSPPAKGHNGVVSTLLNLMSQEFLAPFIERKLDMRS